MADNRVVVEDVPIVRDDNRESAKSNYNGPPLMDLEAGLVGWDSTADPVNPVCDIT